MTTAAKQWKENTDNLMSRIRLGVAAGFTVVAKELTDVNSKRTALDQTDTETQGDFLGNWHLVEDPSQAPSFVEGRYRDNQGDDTLARAESEAVKLARRKKKPLVFYYANTAPYAHKLEYGGYAKNTASTLTTPDGYSTQAPKGIVRKYKTQDRNAVVDEVMRAVRATIRETKARK